MILGAQFFTLRNLCKTTEGLDDCMKKVADIGFTAIQLSGVCAYEPEWVAEKAKEYGLEIVITHTAYDKIVNDTDATIDFHKKMNCHYIGLGSIPGCRDITPDKFGEFVTAIRPAAEKIAAAGLKFMYHNHDMEFAKNPENGKTYLECIMDALPAEILGTTLDTYWVQAGGADPALWLRKTKGRNDCVHFKDMVYHIEDKKIRIATIGEGNMNYPAIIEACREVGVKYGFVELDNCYGADPIECMKKSYEYLTKSFGLK